MSGFLERLTPEALSRLRLVVRKQMYLMGFPKEHIESALGKREIDRMIDTYTQQTAEDMTMRGMRSGLIERRISNR